MDKASKHYTVFTMGNLGFFECKCMLFGLCNAPAMFQSVIQNCLGELNLTYCVLEHNLGCAIRQHVDAKQLSPPIKWSQQCPIIISLTRVMPG